MIVREVLDNGMRLVTEAMPHVRSVAIGAWLTRGSRHEGSEQSGIAHFIEHMLFKGTTSRSAEDIAQAIDSIGGQLDAFTAKEYGGYYVKVLDEHLPVALGLLADILLNPAFDEEDIEKEKQVVLEEIKMVEDTPDDLVHELFVQHFWPNHPLGRPILGVPSTVEGLTQNRVRAYFGDAYAAPNLLIAAAGNLDHAHVREMVLEVFASLPTQAVSVREAAPSVEANVVLRNKDLEQSHVCLGTAAYPQTHEDRYVAYVLNTILGGSMSSRLFQNVRERRGLAYSVFSSLLAYRDAGSLTIYAGCANSKVGEVVDVVVDELQAMRVAVPEAELQRAKDHLKGSLMLSLESTSSRMSHLARQELYFDRQFSLDETIAGVGAVTVDDVLRVAGEMFVNGSLAASVVGPVDHLQITRERLDLGQ